MEVRLVYQPNRSSRRQVMHLRSDETLIGRQSGVDLRIPSAEVSRRHCIIRKVDGYLTVEDLDSANGTFVNSERVTRKEVVRPGDRLSIGPIEFVVEYQLTQDAVNRLRRKQRKGSEMVLEDIEEMEENEVAEEEVEAIEEGADDPLAPLPADEFTIGEVESEDEDTREGEEIVDIGDDWALPATEDLRDILADLDSPPEPKNRKKK